VDTATLGSAIVAGYGVGMYNDIAKTAEGFIRLGAEVASERSAYERYAPYSQAYLESFSALSNIFHKLGVR
jgi:sugar (pentulose or hexulose) kinase